VHEGAPDTEIDQSSRDEEIRLPIRIQGQKAHGTEINSVAYQMVMLDYPANAGYPFQIGVPVHDGRIRWNTRPQYNRHQ
jgi:hypothetical protein